MKRLLTIVIGCSLALAAGAMAQQDDTSKPGKKKKKQQQQEEQQQQTPSDQGGGQAAERPARQARPARDAKPASEARPMQQNRKAMRQNRAAADTSPDSGAASKPAPDTASETKARSQNAADARADRPANQMKKGRNAADETAPANETAPADATAPAGKTARAGKKAAADRKTATDKTAETSSAGASTQTSAAPVDANRPGRKGRAGKKPSPQVVAKVKTEHANFKASPKPEKVPTVSFSQSYRINGADRWQGPQYEVFRSYRPSRHDQGWYRSRYTRIEIIAGGAYYFNNGYWYPAWGYNPANQYYAYDAPIYVGSQARPPDRVIADVQAILQELGYYRGEVDGLLGPLTREALTGYQTDNGLYATAVIDEPTLASLDLG